MKRLMPPLVARRLIAVAVVGVTVAGCGSDGANSPSTLPQTVSTAAQPGANSAPGSDATTASGSGSGAGSGSTVGSPAAGKTAGSVTVRLLAFQPESLEVAAGTEVTWLQQDPGAHTVTSGTVQSGSGSSTEQPDGRFDSGEIATGATFRFTFSKPGNYPYFCSLHPATMRAVVSVS